MLHPDLVDYEGDVLLPVVSNAASVAEGVQERLYRCVGVVPVEESAAKEIDVDHCASSKALLASLESAKYIAQCLPCRRLGLWGRYPGSHKARCRGEGTRMDWKRRRSASFKTVEAEEIFAGPRQLFTDLEVLGMGHAFPSFSAAMAESIASLAVS